MTVSQSVTTFYKENGYIPAMDVFSANEVECYRNQFNQLEEREGKEKSTFGLQNLHFKERFVWEMATHPRVLDLMQQVMGKDILLFRTVFMCKYPSKNARGFFAWHQDGAYWGLEPPDAHIAWIAVDDSDTENGCLRVISGSHKSEMIIHKPSEQEGNFLRIDQSIPSEYIDESLAVNLVQKAGSMSIHHAQTFHASNPNKSERRRCGLIVSYVEPGVKQGREYMKQRVSSDYKWRPFSTVLVRGEDSYRHFASLDSPYPLS